MYSTRSDLVAEMLLDEDAQAQPYIPTLWTLTGLRIALEEAQPGARFGDHVLMAALPEVINPRYDLVHIVVSRRPFSPAERERFAEECDRRGFSLLKRAHSQGLIASGTENSSRRTAERFFWTK
jgi:hypothetical protein